MPILSDIWDRATPEAPGWDVWLGAAPWLSQHLWWHWEFGRDRAFLREVAYPFLKLIAEFYADYLIRDDPWLPCSGSVSVTRKHMDRRALAGGR